MKYAAILLGSSILLGGCGGCGGADDPTVPDAGDPEPDAGPEPGPDPATGAWRTGFSLPGLSGFGSRVEAIAVDGDDVYAAGIFGDAAGLPVAGVARWDGADWVALGDGIDGWVRGLDVDEAGLLWAGVSSHDTSSGSVMRWDGETWTSMATFDGPIVDLAEAAGAVVVVGGFTTAGGVAAAGVAAYYKGGWHALGDGTISGSATAVWTDALGVCVAGAFDAIGGIAIDNAACFDGNEWTPLGVGLPGGVAVLDRSPAGVWFAGGTMTFTVDPETGAYEAGIAILNGDTWEPFEGGIDNGFINEVRAIGFDGDDVLVGGHFLTAGDDDVPARHLARWSPTDGWTEVGGGLASTVGVVLEYLRGTGDIVVEDDGALWIGGIFTQVGDTPAVNIASIPPAGEPVALVGPRPVNGVAGFIDGLAATPDGDVIAGGWFPYAGTSPLGNLGQFDGETWTALDGGVPGTVYDVLLLADGRLAVAGDLFGDLTAFAVLDGGDWTFPGGRVTGLGIKLLVDDDGALWLGGDYLDAAGTPGTLFRLDGDVWTSGGDLDGRVSAIVEHDGELVIGGSFTGAVATRDGDGEWVALGGGLDGKFGYVNVLASSPAGLYVGGSFEGVGGVDAPNLAVWNGTSWQDAGADFSVDDFAFISALLPYGDGLFVAGGFTEIGGVATSNLAWFDGDAWHDLDGGLADLAESMVVIDDVLYIGGPFTEAGGIPSSGIEAWDFAE